VTTPTEQHDTAPERFDETTGEVLDSDAPDNGGWDKERHCITDLRGADWAGRKFRDADQQIRLNEEMAEGEIEALNRKMIEVRERLRQADAPFRRTVDYFRNALEVFAQANRAEVLKGLRSDAKSRLLPSGVRIGWKSREGGYRWDPTKTDAQNRSALMPFALSRGLTKPGPVQIDLEAVKAELAALHDPEQPRFTPPGLEYVPPGETLSVTTKGKE